MTKIFGTSNPDFPENVTSLILDLAFAGSPSSLASTVSKSWHAAVKLFQQRKQVHSAILAKCEVFTQVKLHDFFIEQLSGGLTNTTYKVTISGQPYVARLPGKETSQYINRGMEYTNASIASELQINPAIIYYDTETGMQVTAFLKNPVPMDLEKIKLPANLNAAMKTLKAIHASEKPFAGNIDVFARNEKMYALIESQDKAAIQRYISVTPQMHAIQTIVSALELPRRPCHNDTTPPNFVSSEGKMYLIDWEYSGNNYPIWDLVCLAMEGKFNAENIQQMLASYFGETTAELTHLFYLLAPIYEYWVVLWARTQLVNNNTAEIENMLAMENERLDHCVSLLDGKEFQSAMQYFSKMKIDAAQQSDQSTPSSHVAQSIFSPLQTRRQLPEVVIPRTHDRKLNRSF